MKKHRYRLLIGIGVIASLTGSGAHAQEPDDVGLSVRIHSVDPDTEPLMGGLVSATRESFVIREGSGATDVISTSMIEKVEVSEGLRRHVGLGALIGFLSGAAMGATYGETSPDRWCSGDCGHDKAVAFGVLFGIIGAVPGALVGAVVRTEEWVEVAPNILYDDRPADEPSMILQRRRRMRSLPLSVELGLGPGYAGHGAGLTGKFSLRVIPGRWGVGVRLMAMDGARRRSTSCFIFCNPIESFTETSVLIHRRIDMASGERFYLGVGVGRLSGRRFIGSTTEFERDLSELGMSFEASAYANPRHAVGIAIAANGRVGPGGITLGVTFGVELGG